MVQQSTEPIFTKNEAIDKIGGQRYIDDIIAHRVDEDSDSTYDETYYHLTDELFSTVAILDSSAALVERANYDSYGDVMHQFFNDVDHDGDGDYAQ